MKSILQLVRRNVFFTCQKLKSERFLNAQNAVAVFVERPFHHDGSRGNHDRKSQKQFAKVSALTVLVCWGIYEVKKTEERTLLYAAEGDHEQSGAGVSSRRNAYNFVADVVEMSGSAVVFIERLGRIPFRRHQVPVSHGSGFIIESKGWIITNAHVVGNQSRLKVRLQDGREFEGQVLGVDEGMDLAVVEIKGKDFPYLRLGCSNDIRPGEWVVAMGSPLNLKNTVTAGIVSNIHRAGKELGLSDYDKREMGYIQTDAMINVGNSGGPLINLDGEVIGVNAMMASAGIGFAIPIDCVNDFLIRLKEAMKQRRRNSTGQIDPVPGRRRYIGITMLTLTEDIADQLRLRDPSFPNVTGVLVHRVQHNSPADKSGLQDGDVIIRINGQEVRTTRNVYDALKISQSIQVAIRRGDKVINLRIEPEDVV